MEKLIKKYKDSLQNVINPDDLTWDDIGCDEPIEGFKDINDYLENGDEAEFDEGEQTEISLYHEIINDLEKCVIITNKKLTRLAQIRSVL